MTDQNASIDMNETSSTRPNNSVDGINNANFKKANTNSSSSKNTNQRIHTSKDRQLINVVVSFLDESTTVFQVDHKALGRTLFYQVCESLNLIEVDYFGLSYVDSHGIQYWLDFEKPICKQLSLSSNGPNLSMSFSVKFYTIEPSSLEDDLTRYLFALQIKKDLADGNLLCSENVAALLSSYIIQAECGDYNVEEYSNHFYISKFKLLPQQDDEFEFKVMENHKKLIGLSPGEADLQLLEFAKQLDMYGIKLSPVKDHEGVPLNLSVIHNGILIFQNHTKVNTFEWLKVRKLSFKRKRFFIKLHQEEFFGDVLEFVFQHRNECKNFWKKCIEQHSFFKCYEIKAKSRQKLRIFSRGSSFRYAGRTQQQISEYIKSNNAAATRNAKQKAFQRSSSMKLPDSTIKEEDCFGYSSDMNDTPNSGSLKGQDNNPDSISYTTSCNTMRQMYKSCDTIDQESGLNYYSLHSMMSFATNNSLINDDDEYNLHATAGTNTTTTTTINQSTYANYTNQSNNLLTNHIRRHCKYNSMKSRPRRYNLHNKLYLSMRIAPHSYRQTKYVRRGELPCLTNFSANDDSTSYNDCFHSYLQLYFQIKRYISYLASKAISLAIKPYLSSESNLIVRLNIENYFHHDFKQFNFDLNFDQYCRMIRLHRHSFSKEDNNKQFDLKSIILNANLASFSMF